MSRNVCGAVQQTEEIMRKEELQESIHEAQSILEAQALSSTAPTGSSGRKGGDRAGIIGNSGKRGCRASSLEP